MTRGSFPAFWDDLGGVSFCPVLMCWYIGRKRELLLDTNREIASELTREKTKYRLIPCLVKRRQENAEYAYEVGQQILFHFNSRTNVPLAREYATSRTMPSTAITIARHGDAVTEHSRQKFATGPYFVRHVYNILLILYFYCVTSSEK